MINISSALILEKLKTIVPSLLTIRFKFDVQARDVFIKTAESPALGLKVN